jgi:hypothetical protein
MPQRYVCNAPCYRSFTTTRALVAHRMNRMECRERWDTFLHNLTPYEDSSEYEEANAVVPPPVPSSNASTEPDSSNGSQEEEVPQPTPTPREPHDTDRNEEEVFNGAGHIFAQGEPPFLEWRRKQESLGHNLYYPFAGRKEWLMACWLHKSQLSMSLIDDFLRMEYVSLVYTHSRHSTDSFLDQVSFSLLQVGSRAP